MTETIADKIVPVGLQMISKSISDPVEMSMVGRWLREYDAFQKRRARPKLILAAIAEGYDTASEIAAETGIPEASVRRLLIELVGRGKVESAKTKNMNSRIEIRWALAV